MTQFKGTPGPWVADIRGGCAAIYPQDRANDTPGLHSDDSRNVAYSCKGAKFNGMHWELDKSVEHDFRVMAAAPELLEVLQLMLDSQVLPVWHQSIARAAINKATGETK